MCLLPLCSKLPFGRDSAFFLKEIGPSSLAPDIQAESPLLMDSDSEEEVPSPILLEAPVHNLINSEFPATMLKSWKIQP